jgi:undecaprenyl pyrophosphate phosphatase UppP
MHFNLLAYAGPDQVMTVTSGLASIIGVLLIFWHKVVAMFRKLVSRIRGTSTAAPAPVKDIPSQNS